ncbi:MAG: Trx7/PDZ domain-containing (seleno)protein [Isosphaeraceae bacterium]|nr:Trx7/PDZ domain-containing (seleno)protein [Isosphaeraceae bacterium]
MIRYELVLVPFLLAPSFALAQNTERDKKVKADRESFSGSTEWIYNDIDAGIRAAKTSGKPILVAFRCIPCEACHDFDEDVANRDPLVRDLMDQFVLVRIVYGNNIDLRRFQYDFDQSFAIVLMNADGTIYGRFATRSERPESEDISLDGLRAALGSALRMHKSLPEYEAALEGKKAVPGPYATPRDFPSLKGRYQADLDYEGAVAKSCIHCHQIGEAQRLAYRNEGKSVPDDVLFPYPDPEVLGLTMNPKKAATVARVMRGSIADRAGIREGDEIATLGGQPLISTADIQWVLHRFPKSGTLKAEVRRGEMRSEVDLMLAPGWREGNISWRVTSWDLRRMALGGMRLEPATEADRTKNGIGADELAIRVKSVGQYGEHALAKKAGVKAGDLLVAYDGIERAMTESQIFAHALRQKKRGEKTPIVVIRDGRRISLEFAQQ